MALNKYMHPRNVYKSRKPDFKSLAIKYEYFREKVTQNLSGKVILDFKDPSALRALTQALLADDFGLTVTLPLDRLIPTVPQRLNYILWLEDILGQNKPARGIDIGTGASCIYPLLGCRQNGWEFLASDIDDQNIQFATQNVERNKMQDKITIKKVTDDTMLLGLVDETSTYDFCMCNPPFFTDHLEAQGVKSTRKDERPEAHSISTASEKESVSWGGEVRFVTQMMEESLVLKDKVRIYTSLLGKKMSVSLLKDELQKKKISKFSTTEFCQGRTMRWGIVWTFDDTIQFPKSAFKEQKNIKPPITYEIPRTVGVLDDYTVPAYTQTIRAVLEDLKVNYHVKHIGKFYTCMFLQAKENTWSHQRRKRRHKKHTDETTDDKDVAISESGDKAEDGDNKVGGNAITDDSVTVQDEHIIVPDSGDSGMVANSKYDTAAHVTTGDTITAQESDRDRTVMASTMVPGSDNIHLMNSCASDSAQNSEDSKYSGDAMDSVPVDMTIKEKDGKKTNEDEESLETKLVAATVRKRTSSDVGSEKHTKRLRMDHNSTDPQCADPNNPDPVKPESQQFKDKFFTEFVKSAPRDEAEINRNSESKNNDTGNIDTDEKPSYLVRKDVIEQFWKEQESNRTLNMDKKKVPKSIYEKLEPFAADDECLLLCKMVLRKDEGIMTFTLTFLQGNKEAMHQIMQYFKNRFTVGKKM